ncbi:aldo/keto reductase [Neptunicella sp. SCSIO 80796]|uniref:aldo/keto reductase n=1 Tax=Neptunicella plasticusilytica TaxID=3117012 RepID=UPI003A4DC69F
MKFRTLGQQGFEVSEVGLGCWQLGGDWGQDFDQQQTFSILDAALDNGVSFLDTADVYGGGKSEKLIGQFLQQSGQQPKIASKFGRGGDVFPDKYSEQALRDGVEASIERLGVSSLDLLQLHCVPTQVLRDGEIFEWLRKLKQQGVIQHFGASVETVEEGLICLEQEGLLSLQVIFNLYRQKLVNELLPQAKEKGVGIIVRLPLASGLLSGKFSVDTRFGQSDHRNFNQNGECFNVGETFAGLPFIKGVELTEQLKQYAPEGYSMAQLALRWILDHDAVSTIIPGASSAVQAKANAAISELPALDADLHQSLSDFYHTQVHQHIRGQY